MLFGKNSDRQRNEAQAVECFPAARHPAGARLKCTYITIPQVQRTHAVLISRPFWIWGAEMGANEHGVVVGNEGLFARRAACKEPALIGMDLLRLALERARSAPEAADVIKRLLESHGQGGNCGHLTPSHYHNSFMIADHREAIVLETVGKDWLLARARGERAISNDYTIGGEAERTSAGLPALLRECGWHGEGAAPDYAAFITDSGRSHIGSARERRGRAQSLLAAGRGDLTVAEVFRTLRDHDPTGLLGREWSPSTSPKYSLCIHAGAENRNVQTTGSMASEIGAQHAVHWLTGTAGPCISIFKPVLMEAGLPDHGALPTDRFDERTLWWRHERLHRAALLGDFATFLESIRAERDTLEADFRSRVAAVLEGGDHAERARTVSQCWQDAIAAEERWHARIDRLSAVDDTAFAAGWRQMNRLAGLES